MAHEPLAHKQWTLDSCQMRKQTNKFCTQEQVRNPTVHVLFCMYQDVQIVQLD